MGLKKVLAVLLSELPNLDVVNVRLMFCRFVHGEEGGLQNAMTSSEERTSAEAEGYRIERALMDCVAPP